MLRALSQSHTLTMARQIYIYHFSASQLPFVLYMCVFLLPFSNVRFSPSRLLELLSVNVPHNKMAAACAPCTHPMLFSSPKSEKKAHKTS